MATLTFTSFERGAIDFVSDYFNKGHVTPVPTKHVWSGFTIPVLKVPGRSRAVFLPRVYLIAKLAAGEVPADYGVDLEEGVFYQRYIPQDYREDDHADSYTVRGTFAEGPYYRPEMEAMTLCFTRGEDDPIWGGETGQFHGAKGITYRFNTGPDLSWVFGWTVHEGPKHKIDISEGGNLFGAILIPSDRTKRSKVWITTSTTQALCRSDHLRGFERKLESGRALPWPKPEEPVKGGRALEIADEDTSWHFPWDRFEYDTSLLMYGLTPTGTGLRPAARTEIGYCKAPDDGNGRLYIHHGRDAWRFIAALPGRRAVRNHDWGPWVWLNFFHVFGVCVRHGEVTDKVAPFRGLPLAEQQRIWAVRGMSSALNHCLHTLKGRIATLSEPLDLFQGKIDPKNGQFALFYDERHPWKVQIKRGVDRSWNRIIQAYGASLGNSRFVVEERPRVQHVAPEALTGGRLIDL